MFNLNFITTVVDYSIIEKIILDYFKVSLEGENSETLEDTTWYIEGEKDGHEYYIEVEGSYWLQLHNVTGASYAGATERWVECMGGDLSVDKILVYVDNNECISSDDDKNLKQMTYDVSGLASWIA